MAGERRENEAERISHQQEHTYTNRRRIAPAIFLLSENAEERHEKRQMKGLKER